jgi:serine/threonine-protein kinase
MLAFDDRSSVSGLFSHERRSGGSTVPEAGSVIGGSYNVIGVLGSGAMGVVLLANDETLERNVAIKFLHCGLLTTTFRALFLDEARAMARVRHPNVVQVHAFGEYGEAPYMVMEFVEGRPLDEWLAERRSPLELDLGLRILEDVCSGVAAIHACNTVHRDIKPSNILLDREQRARVADLGLAVLHRQDDPARAQLVGTPAYMAPELAFSRQWDSTLPFRADVYSVACVAYELFTGAPPFDGSGTMGVLLQHATMAVVAPSQLRPDLPVGLDRALLRALAKDPRERTPSIEAFRNDLLAADRGSLDPERILVAEDNDESREVLKLTLSKAFPTAEIECVADGLAALEAFERKPPSVAILDLRMPGLDGLHLTKRLRERRASAAMPIIVLTASGGPSEWRQLAALGADRLLVKPVVVEDVVALIRRALRERSLSVLQVLA